MIRRIVAVAAVMLGILVAAPGPADAAGSHRCSRYACDGRDPFTYHCDDDAFWIYHERISSGATYELWWSPGCQTSWGVTGAVSFDIQVRSYNANGSLRRIESTNTTLSVRYSPMVFNGEPLTARACLSVPVSGGAYECTDRF